MGGLRVPISELTQILSVHDAQGLNASRLVERSQDPTRNAAVILTTHGAQKLAERDMWFYVSGTTIKDKSKANTIQKALVLCQASWMFLQCIVRKASGLPLALLELHTMVHVFYAFLVYIFWLKVG